MSLDALGWRCKFAIIAPSTNTIVQPDMEAFRPQGVTNHFGRIYVPNMPVHNDEDFIALVEAIGATLNDAVTRCMTSQPDYLIMGMSALMFWDGRDASQKRMAELSEFAGVRVSAGSFACEAALNLTGSKRIAVFCRVYGYGRVGHNVRGRGHRGKGRGCSGARRRDRQRGGE